jgi:hypothetical protein
LVSQDVIDGFMKVATASVADAVEQVAGHRGYMDHMIKPRINDKKIVGPEVTIQEGPTEILSTWKAGADAVKVFPVTAMGGPRYFRMIHEPLPQIPLVATGGVSLKTLPEYLEAGALFVGAGGDLIFKEALKNGKIEQITARAEQSIEAIQNARSKK